MEASGVAGCVWSLAGPFFSGLASWLVSGFADVEIDGSSCYGLGAVGTALGGKRNFAQTFGAGFEGRRRIGCGLLEPGLERVQGQNNGEINHGTYDEKRDDGVEETAYFDVAVAYVDDDVAEVWLADGGGDEGIEDIAHQGCDDGIEGRADDDGDSQIDNVAAQNKVSKTFEHFFLQRVPGESGAGFESSYTEGMG